MGIIITMTTRTPIKAFGPLKVLLSGLAVSLGAATACGQEVVLTPTFAAPVAGQPLPYSVVNHGTDIVSICLTNGWSALGLSGSSPFTVERRFNGKWHKVLGKDLRNQLAQPINPGASATVSMAGLGEPGTYRLELNYVHGLVPSCWAPHEGKIHVLHSDPFDLTDAPAAPKASPEIDPTLKPRPE